MFWTRYPQCPWSVISASRYTHCTKAGKFLAASRHVFPRVGQAFAVNPKSDETDGLDASDIAASSESASASDANEEEPQ